MAVDFSNFSNLTAAQRTVATAYAALADQLIARKDGGPVITLDPAMTYKQAQAVKSALLDLRTLIEKAARAADYVIDKRKAELIATLDT